MEDGVRQGRRHEESRRDIQERSRERGRKQLEGTPTARKTHTHTYI
jgi:hypothetical protein